MRSATVSRRPNTDTTAFEEHRAPELFEQCADLLQEQQSVLLARATRLGVDIEQLQTLTATHGHGETEHAAKGAERVVAEMIEAGTLEALEEIALALGRIDDGSYGICIACSAPISTERLLAMPQTRYCVSCQQTNERGAR
jgi:RNA polymerase-binding transcription factor